ncbi:peptidoglycan recognition protein [Streptomyces sp. NRRL F-2664]|uniref:peptidoglycan recognition protein family protein n=1 Tax=Streptomyces sp. NRRL F-2664 TaxID=1463842 RepID=UPI00068A99F0|nr:peptidoglycan recognition protein [Streptomyces sp. NRRL F-2664]
MRGTALAAALGVVAVLGIQGVASGTGGSDGDEVSPYSARAREKGPVAGELHKLALKPKGRGEAVLSQQDTEPFGLLGVSWADPEAEVKGKIEARTRDADSGKWSKWVVLEQAESGLDGKRPGLRGATEPVWVGPSDGAEVRVTGGGTLPAGMELNLVDPGAGAAKAKKKSDLGLAPAAFALPAVDPAPSTPGPESTAPRPDVVSRVQWGADESLNNEGPVYLPGGKIKAVFVHHTAATTPYECSESAAIVRSLHVYHVKGNGWRDLGYNFLVDKCGTVFEGRQGGVDQPVQGAHTYGWNAESTSVSVLGDYTSAGASAAALDGISKVTAYKLGQYDGDMNGTATLTAGATQTNFSGKSFTAGQQYEFKSLSGHRDGFNTQCPGNSLYPQLEALRQTGPAAQLKVASVNGATATPGATLPSGAALTVDWTTSTATGRLAKFELLVDGEATAVTDGAARKATAVVTDGKHEVRVRATAANGKVSTSLPVTVEAEVKGAEFVPLSPKRLMDTREGLGVRRGPVGSGEVVTLPVAAATGGTPTAVVLNVTATNPTQPSFVSVYPSGTTRSSASNLNFTATGDGATQTNFGPKRLMDTRNGTGVPAAPVGSGGVVTLPVAGVDGIPAVGVKAVVLNVTATNPTQPSFVSVYPSGTTRSSASNLNFTFGPKRLMDTRTGTGVRQGPVTGGGVVTLPVAGVGGVPATGIKAVVLNVTATNPTESSFVSVFPSGTTRTSASNLNFTRGLTIPNLVVVPVVDGKVSFYNNSGSVDLIADITGYFN